MLGATSHQRLVSAAKVQSDSRARPVAIAVAIAHGVSLNGRFWCHLKLPHSHMEGEGRPYGGGVGGRATYIATCVPTYLPHPPLRSTSARGCCVARGGGRGTGAPAWARRPSIGRCGVGGWVCASCTCLHDLFGKRRTRTATCPSFTARTCVPPRLPPRCCTSTRRTCLQRCPTTSSWTGSCTTPPGGAP